MTVSLTSPASLMRHTPYHHVAVATGTRLVTIAGQTAHDVDGGPIAPDDFGGQVFGALQNVGIALGAQGGGFSDVVRLTFYVTEWNEDAAHQFGAAVERATTELGLPSPMPPASLIGAAFLFEPGALVEVEATAVLA